MRQPVSNVTDAGGADTFHRAGHTIANRFLLLTSEPVAPGTFASSFPIFALETAYDGVPAAPVSPSLSYIPTAEEMR